MLGAYVRVIKDIYVGARTIVRTLRADTRLSWYWSSSRVSLFLLTIVINELTGEIQDDVPF